MNHRLPSPSFSTLLILSAALFSFPTQTAHAATCSSVRSGNWNDPGTWSCGLIPGAGDNATINGGDTITVTGDADVMNLTVYGALIVEAIRFAVHDYLYASVASPSAAPSAAKMALSACTSTAAPSPTTARCRYANVSFSGSGTQTIQGTARGRALASYGSDQPCRSANDVSMGFSTFQKQRHLLAQRLHVDLHLNNRPELL